MGIPHLKPWYQTIWGESLPYEIFTALGSLSLVAINATISIQQKKLEGLPTIIIGGVIFLSTVGKAVTGWMQKRKEKSTHELDGCLHTLHAMLTQGYSQTQDHCSRPNPRRPKIPTNPGLCRRLHNREDGWPNLSSAKRGDCQGISREKTPCGPTG